MSSLKYLKRRLATLVKNLEIEEADINGHAFYIYDLKCEIKKVENEIKQYEFSEQNPIVMINEIETSLKNFEPSDDNKSGVCIMEIKKNDQSK